MDDPGREGSQGSGSSSRRGMIPSGALEQSKVEIARSDQDEVKEDHEIKKAEVAGGTEPERQHSRITEIIHGIDAYLHTKLKWRYRLLVGSLIFLVSAIAILATVAILYGFSLTYPRVEVTSVTLADPAHVWEADGSIPIKTTIRYTNPNPWPVQMHASNVELYTDPERDNPLSSTLLPAAYLQPHSNDNQAEFIFYIRNINEVPGGRQIMDNVMKNDFTFIYTRNMIKLTTWALGFVPMNRMYRMQCRVLQKWGPGAFAMSDCYGRFIRS